MARCQWSQRLSLASFGFDEQTFMARRANAAHAGIGLAQSDRRRAEPKACQTKPFRLPAPAHAARYRHARRQGAGEVAHDLAQNAEAVCRHYLSNGRRSGGYWHVGDVANTPGQSLYVRLSGSRAGKWCDAATAEHGDLLDLIALTRKLPNLKQALAEARQFLDGAVELPAPRAEPGTSDKTRAAQRLFGKGGPIRG